MIVGDCFLKSKNRANLLNAVEALFFEHDIVFGNLETVISKRGISIEKRLPIRVSPAAVNYLRNAGFDIFNLANNHVMDYGDVGLCDTIAFLEENNIRYVGAGKDIGEAIKPTIIERNGLKIGSLGFTLYGVFATDDSSGCAPANKELIIKCLSELRKKVDILIVSLHWGIEYVFYPSPKQQKLARTLIDNGADLIIGHHPHVIQGLEEYKNKLIIYSLGNFNFGVEQDKNYKDTDIGLIISVEFLKGRIKNYELIPAKIDSNCVPTLLKGGKKLEVLEFINKISLPLQNKITPWFWYEEASTVYLSSQIQSYSIRIKRYGPMHLYLFIRWLFSPFVLKMILGWIRKKLSKSAQNVEL